MTFISEYGHVRYTPGVALSKLHSGKACEGCAQPSSGLDHCHAHGWIRGTLCARCNRGMQDVDARYPGPHPQALLDHWANCPDCAAAGPWCPGDAPERPKPGHRYSVYLSDDLAAAAKASGVPYSELVRRGLAIVEGEKGNPAATAGRILREELARAGLMIVPIEPASS